MYFKEIATWTGKKNKTLKEIQLATNIISFASVFFWEATTYLRNLQPGETSHGRLPLPVLQAFQGSLLWDVGLAILLFAKAGKPGRLAVQLSIAALRPSCSLRSGQEEAENLGIWIYTKGLYVNVAKPWFDSENRLEIIIA